MHDTRHRTFVLALLLVAGIGRGAGQGFYEPALGDELDWEENLGYQSDPAYEQYAERLQQQLESLRKEHDEIFGRADANKVRAAALARIICSVVCGTPARVWPLGDVVTGPAPTNQPRAFLGARGRPAVGCEACGLQAGSPARTYIVADASPCAAQDGAMSEDEYYAMHREAEHGDDKNRYDDKELERAFADLDKDTSASLSLDEWRRPFEEHTDAWLQVSAFLPCKACSLHTACEARGRSECTSATLRAKGMWYAPGGGAQISSDAGACA